MRNPQCPRTEKSAVCVLRCAHCSVEHLPWPRTLQRSNECRTNHAGPTRRIRPWKLASETVTLDHLSNGRVILSVGVGAIDTGFDAFGEVTDRKTRAELLDEELDILTGLWRGQPFSYEGKHYRITAPDFKPPPRPVQQPRIPIWVVGMWPRMKSMRRVAKYDGLLPTVQGREVTPDDICEMTAFGESHRALASPFDVVMEGRTPGDDPRQAAAIIRPWEEAGATWWIESRWDEAPDVVLTRLRQGPPRLG